MMTFKTSATALLALGLIAGASTAASACEWQKQVMAKAPAPEKTAEQASSPATSFDPMVLARTQSPEPESRTVEQ